MNSQFPSNHTTLFPFMLTIINADLHNEQHAHDVLTMLNSYAQDPMGGGEALSDYCQQNLINELKKRSTVRVVLAYAGDQAAGLAICIEGFSTFACKPLLNIHDFAVHPDFRGQHIGVRMMEHITQLAIELGYCKITLEVLEGNLPARQLYLKQGFATYELDPAMGGAIMMQKKLS